VRGSKKGVDNMAVMRTARRRQQRPTSSVSGGVWAKLVAEEVIAKVEYIRDRDGEEVKEPTLTKGGK
jgi:hypothetical protein